MTKGWHRESARHSLARKGIKTGRKIQIKSPIRQISRYVSDEGFEFTFEPVEDTITVEETKDGYTAKYLVYDTDPQSPDEWGDESLFLVHYHRDFEIKRDDVITEDDARNWYQGEKIPQEKEYWIFPVEAYIHGMVHLTLGSFKGRLPQGHYEFDVSHVGLILVSKKEAKTKAKAMKYAEGLLENWNMYLSNDVYGIVVERYDKNKQQIDQDAVWGHYGQKYALQELKDFEGFEG